MRLVDKFTIWFIIIFVLVTPVSMFISYRSIKERMDTSETVRLTDLNNHIAMQLKSGAAPQQFTISHPITIERVAALPVNKVEVSEEQRFNRNRNQNECKLTVSSFYNINDSYYKISSYNDVTKSKEILNGMLRAVFWKMALIILLIVITTRLVSKYILSSFQKTLDTIQVFSLRQREKLELPETNTKEFRQLNSFLKKMTDKAADDYSKMKEFSENASHELQTPLAIIRSKLELFAETDISAEQADLIGDMQNAIEKLVRINRSLLLLTKLENLEYEAAEDLRFCKITNSVLASFENWIQLKNISLVKNVDKKVSLRIHPSLAEILLTNLLSNAIRYNWENGSIVVTLTSHSLTIKNTGSPLEIPAEQLFQRFKKSNQCAESVGLGLAIVKQICNVNGFHISYNYLEGYHILQVEFTKSPAIAEAFEEKQVGILLDSPAIV
ncbi:hypothetical protein GS399_00940 [Pedobacter sp. HMF7647]|uniref:histidine kinase n=1 Tax=Hufsiella arboris TaxID=2695275 RepID=A0A7K1Y584_9SPHI|nr:HAMP domain-containing sensor histidine kinase [Hufsiella arboris]MXV49521.1 hypothetical protein [Hufsiella arboris]